MKSIILSHRERQVLDLIAFEYSTKEIAKKLILSPHTVVTHRRNLLEKLGARNIAGLVRISFEVGLFQNHFAR